VQAFGLAPPAEEADVLGHTLNARRELLSIGTAASFEQARDGAEVVALGALEIILGDAPKREPSSG
jgi:hypothetical protein